MSVRVSRTAGKRVPDHPRSYDRWAGEMGARGFFGLICSLKAPALPPRDRDADHTRDSGRTGHHRRNFTQSKPRVFEGRFANVFGAR
jgi:hypothetical protein